MFASIYYRSLEQKNYQITLVLSLLVALAVALTALVQIAIHLRRMRSSDQDSHPTIVVTGRHERKQFGHILKDVQSEVCFLGILAKRTVNSDGFKEFLADRMNRPIKIRFLLLDPSSPVFRQRANDENESVIAWKQDLTSTLHRLSHYARRFSAIIEVHLYNVYPVWRIMIVDKRCVVVNFFLQGRRGTQSEQLLLSGADDDWTQAHVDYFEVLWSYHSKEVKLDDYHTQQQKL